MTVLDINKVNNGNKARFYTKDGWIIKDYLKSKKAYRARRVYGNPKDYKLFTKYEYENAEVISLYAGVASSLNVTIDLVAESQAVWW